MTKMTDTKMTKNDFIVQLVPNFMKNSLVISKNYFDNVITIL